MVTICKNPYGDTRTVPRGNKVEFTDFQAANDSHKREVSEVMSEFANMIIERGKAHDSTKKNQERMFYRDFQDTLANGNNFAESEWYQMHIRAERHHLSDYCPEDVNLIDVLEMIVDWVCATLARGTKIGSLDIDDVTLHKAIGNTVEMIMGMTNVGDRDE